MHRFTSNLVAIAMAAAAMASRAAATELWDPHLRGLDEGTVAGALPPPGLYGILETNVVGFKQYDSNGHRTPCRLDAIVEVPVLLWQTGWKVFGADYAVAIAQPFDYTNMKVPGTAALSANGHWGTYNTVLVPGILSWTFEDGLHVSTGLSVYLDDASSSPGDPPEGGGVGAGNGFASLQPDFGVSWLYDGWNFSLSGHTTMNFRNAKTDYTSGQELALDYTVTKQLGLWTLGLGGFQEEQLTHDSGAGAVARGCPHQDGCRVSLFGLGPIAAYQFGGLEIIGMYDFGIAAKNDVAGDVLKVRLIAPL